MALHAIIFEMNPAVAEGIEYTFKAICTCPFSGDIVEAYGNSEQEARVALAQLMLASREYFCKGGKFAEHDISFRNIRKNAKKRKRRKEARALKSSLVAQQKAEEEEEQRHFWNGMLRED